jgi:amino acid adenylation domain-containing protein
LYLRGGDGGAAGLPPLRAAPRDHPLPLSFAQERLWYLQKLDPEGAAYNLQANLRFTGAFDRGVLQRALVELVRRHEPLRTRFEDREGRPVQVIDPPPAEVPLPVHDLGGLPPAERAREAQRVANAEARRPFDLERAPSFRARLLALGPDAHELLVTQHHLITDGWSIALLVEDLLALHGALARGAPVPPPASALQYADFASWQRQWLDGEALERQLAYWRQRLRGAPPALELPTDRPRPPVQTSRGATLAFRLPKDVADAVRATSRAEGVSPFMTLLAAFKAVLARHCGQDDILVGTANGNRPLVETERVLGLFVNTLVLRTDLGGNPTFRELLGRVRRGVLDAYAHGELPFEKLVEDLRPPRDLSRSPIFQVLFVIQNTPLEALNRDGQKGVIGERGTAGYDLSVYLIETADGYAGSLEYSTDLFDEGTIARLAGHFRTLLEAAVRAPGTRVRALPMLEERERDLAVRGWNQTPPAAVPEPLLHRAIAAQAARTPDRVAVACGPEALTYREVEARANQLARRLRALGVRAEDRVGIALERSAGMVVALLGTLKAGAAYVPLDPGFPAARLALMAEDAGLRALVTQESLREEVPQAGAAVLSLDGDREALAAESDQPLSGPDPGPDALAYILYTSGSTGRPKGVQVPHRALTTFLAATGERPGLGPDDALLAVTTLSFDIAGLELYLPLLRGARVEIATREEATDGGLLLARLQACGATVMQATPATWRLLVEAGWGGGTLKVLCGGEALPGDLAAELLRRGSSVWNMYGPTETTIWSAVHRVEAAEPVVPLGQPIAQTRLFVLDRYLEPLPPGADGELYIGGAGVARGYWNRPDLTAERFLPDPFAEEPGARMYRTGDRVRRRPDGTVDFLGRLDTQVKVRGFRIEVAEVEAELRRLPGVRQAVVVTRSHGGGDSSLAAYVVFGAGVEPTVTEMRTHLKRALPPYMVPSSFVALDALPLTPNGKVDRRALAALDGPPSHEPRGVVAPRTGTERLVAEVWQEMLGVATVSVHDNFFDLGGHSLLSMRALARLEKALGLRLNPREMVFQTLEQFAAMCDGRRAAG